MTPRRLALSVHGVPARQPDVREEKKGPRVGAPDNAIAGFLKAAGLKSIDEAKVQPDKKGDFYVAVIEKPGRPAIEVIGEIFPEVIKGFPGRSRCGGASNGKTRGSPGCGRCIRSLPHSGRKPRSRTSCRSRSTASRPATRRAATASWRRRRSRCAGSTNSAQARQGQGGARCRAPPRHHPHRGQAACLRAGAGTGRGRGLLAEVSGLVEWPVVLMGSFDQRFLQIPEEVIRATIRNNQKCFVLRDAAHAKLVNKFILVSNSKPKTAAKPSSPVTSA